MWIKGEFTNAVMGETSYIDLLLPQLPHKFDVLLATQANVCKRPSFGHGQSIGVYALAREVPSRSNRYKSLPLQKNT